MRRSIYRSIETKVLHSKVLRSSVDLKVLLDRRINVVPLRNFALDSTVETGHYSTLGKLVGPRP